MAQVAAGARVECKVVVGMKFGFVTVGVAIWREIVPVLVTEMVCVVAVGPGTFWNVRAVGFRERPGSAEPKPVSWAVTLPAEAARVRVPMRWPVVAGVKAIWTKQRRLRGRGFRCRGSRRWGRWRWRSHR